MSDGTDVPGDHLEGELKVIAEAADVPAELPAATRLLAEAKAAGRLVTIVATSAESRKIMAKRRHDLKAALRTLTFTVKALKDGYTFQDAAAAAKVEAIAKAVLVLEREAALLERVLPG